MTKHTRIFSNNHLSAFNPRAAHIIISSEAWKFKISILLVLIEAYNSSDVLKLSCCKQESNTDVFVILLLLLYIYFSHVICCLKSPKEDEEEEIP